jgi:hypothetical protein
LNAINALNDFNGFNGFNDLNGLNNGQLTTDDGHSRLAPGASSLRDLDRMGPRLPLLGACA